MFLVLGGSGTGKSTMLRTMIGLQPPLGGSIELEGAGTSRCSTASGLLRRQLPGRRPVRLHDDRPERGAAPGAVDRSGWGDHRRYRRRKAPPGRPGAGGQSPPSELSAACSSGRVSPAAGPRNDLPGRPSAGLDPVTSARRPPPDPEPSPRHDPRRRDPRTREHLSHRHRCFLLDRDTRHHRRGDRGARDSTDPRVRAFFHRESVTGED